MFFVHSTCAFAKAGYDNFSILINDPIQAYTGKIIFKYNCGNKDGNQVNHVLQASRAMNLLAGNADHNLICGYDADNMFRSGHLIKSITISLLKTNQNTYVTRTYSLDRMQHANSTLRCAIQADGSGSCAIFK